MPALYWSLGPYQSPPSTCHPQVAGMHISCSHTLLHKGGPAFSRRCSSSTGTRQHRAVWRHQSYSSSNQPTGSTSGAVLEAFYYGRAFAQVLGERLNSTATELLSEFGKMDAERRQAFKEFQEEVEAKAAVDLLAESPSTASYSSWQPTNGSSRFSSDLQSPVVELVKIPAPDLQEAVDELRAEIASARATLQQLMRRGGPNASFRN